MQAKCVFVCLIYTFLGEFGQHTLPRTANGDHMKDIKWNRHYSVHYMTCHHMYPPVLGPPSSGRSPSCQAFQKKPKTRHKTFRKRRCPSSALGLRERTEDDREDRVLATPARLILGDVLPGLLCRCPGRGAARRGRGRRRRPIQRAFEPDPNASKCRTGLMLGLVACQWDPLKVQFAIRLFPAELLNSGQSGMRRCFLGAFLCFLGETGWQKSECPSPHKTWT